jgi:uncharacterized protein (DUF433 family)
MNTENVWTDKDRCSGKPCVRGHRFTVAQLLAELAEGERNLKEICEDFRLPFDKCQGAIHDVIIEALS